MSAATYSIAVAAEDWGHYRAVTRLADRVLAEVSPWYSDILTNDEHPTLIDDIRRWGTGPDERPWSPLKHAFDNARARGLPCHGHFNGEPGKSDAWMFRAQLLLFQAECIDGRAIDAVVVARDVDDDPERIAAARQVSALTWPFPVVLALCNPEIEAWHVAGFEPEDDRERARLTELRSKLGFSPPREPQRLNSKQPDDPKDAKRVCDHLCDADNDRKQRCLEAPLTMLLEHGYACGLADFLAASTRGSVLSSPAHAPNSRPRRRRRAATRTRG
jgi:hypothetical protein